MELLQMWSQFKKIPGGSFIFSKLLGLKIPYTGSMSAHVTLLEAGRANVELPDKRANRNHLNCVHAIALLNVAELSTGLAVTSQLPAGGRMILKNLSIDYLLKARGTIRAEATCAAIADLQKKEVRIESTLFDVKNNVVARAQALWQIGAQS